MFFTFYSEDFSKKVNKPKTIRKKLSLTENADGYFFRDILKMKLNVKLFIFL